MSFRGLYGYAPDLSFVDVRDPERRADALAALGANVIFGGYDDPALAAALRARGVRVMAEFACFAGRAWWERYPQSRPLLADGTLLGHDDRYWGVTPTHAGVQTALLERLRELVQRQSLDGVWLDFIRWPCRWEAPVPPLPETSFDAATVAAFCRDLGLPSMGAGPAAAQRILADYDQAWRGWRCAQVASFAAEAAAIVRAAQSGCLVGAFTVPWRKDDWGGALQRIVGQDLAALARHLDVFSPMVYHRMCGQQPPWIAAVCEDLRAATARPVWPIIQSVDEPLGMTPEEYRSALETALVAGEGALIYNLRGLEHEARRAATSVAFAVAR
jgi:hypothetical protein